MDAEVIVILVFAALSLLGAVADKARPKGDGRPASPPPTLAQRLPDGGVLLASGEKIAAGTPEAEAFWWLPAPAASHEESSSETEDLEDGVISMEPVTQADDRSLEPVGTPSWERGAREERAAPVRAVLETPEVDWNAEHERFHRKYVDGQPPTAAQARSSILAGMRGRHGLRQAILAAEILGPPRALRPPDER